MYYRGNNNEIIEAYSETDGGGNDGNCGTTPTWLIILLISILVLVIGFLIYYKLIKKS